MNSLLVGALLVASTLFAMTESFVVTGVAVGSTALAAGGLVVGALALGAKKLLLLKAIRRGKRDASSCASFDNPDTYFALAASGDSLDCGRRFVCEVQAAPEQNLTTEELLIRNLFG